MPEPDLSGGFLNLQKTTNILGQLQKLGADELVYSPGSRNTPVAIAAHQTQHLQKTVIIDERSAGFYAIGRAKATGKPVILSCTSGSALANYYPAAVEAFYMHVPLVFLTADRPGYLIGTGSPQTMQQHAFFGQFAPTFELGEQETHLSEQQWLSFIDTLEKQLPAQINIPFEKPLQPDESDIIKASADIHPELHLHHSASLQPIPLPALQLFQKAERPIAVFGPSSSFPNPNQEAFDFCERLHIPVIAESLSNIDSIDSDVALSQWQGLVRYWATLDDTDPQRPDLILRFDRQPVAKGLELLFEKHQSIHHLHVYNKENERHDATFSTDLHLRGVFNWEAGASKIKPYSNKWLSQINKINNREYYISEKLTDGQTFSKFSGLISKNTAVHLANSFPVRDFDMFAHLATPERVYCNRGLNGIDGTIVTAISESRSHEQTFLFIGDVTFAHDIGSLQLHQLAHHLTIVVINNGGGTIFDMLPIRNYSEEFRDQYFRTQPAISVVETAKGFGIPSQRLSHQNELDAFIGNFKPAPHIQIIEVLTDPKESNNERLSRWKW